MWFAFPLFLNASIIFVVQRVWKSNLCLDPMGREIHVKGTIFP